MDCAFKSVGCQIQSLVISQNCKIWNKELGFYKEGFKMHLEVSVSLWYYVAGIPQHHHIP